MSKHKQGRYLESKRRVWAKTAHSRRLHGHVHWLAITGVSGEEVSMSKIFKPEHVNVIDSHNYKWETVHDIEFGGCQIVPWDNSGVDCF